MRAQPLGSLMIGLPNTTLDARDKELLNHPNVGGVVLFDRNYEAPQQLSELTTAIHALRQSPLLIAVDHEGGRVQRFRDGFSLLPPVRALGDVYDHDKTQALLASEQFGWLMAAELRACGVDLSFAPVLDLDRGISDVIGNRAFHGNFQHVAELARASMRGMKKAGMMAVGKHFPGHGGVVPDTHKEVAEDTRPWVDLNAEDIAVFERMIHYGLSAIMTAHVIYPQIDTLPASLSPSWISGSLRQTLKFEGAIFSDDMMMQGVADLIDDPVERCQQALEAGSDAVLLCNDNAVIEATVERLKVRISPSHCIRLSHLHGKPAPSFERLTQTKAWHHAQKALTAFAPTEQRPLF